MAKETSNNTKLSYKINFKENEPNSFETDSLIIRHFKSEDWANLQQIAISKENSAFADCDHTWTTDEDGIKGACDYFATEKQFVRLRLKAFQRLFVW